MKKCLSLVLSLVMIFMMTVSPVSAGGLIGNLETDIQIQGLSDLSVRTLVSRYFSQRKAYLQGVADTIEVVVEPMVTDEAAHKTTIVEANAVLDNSTVVINTVLIGDYVAEVTATETATFVIAGELTQETIVHTICIYENREEYLIISSDGYRELTTGFVSASYIGAEVADLNTTLPYGSHECIIGVAMEEIGYTEMPPFNNRGNGYTKYGAWYDSLMGTTSFAYDEWCTSFVSWCANQANVPSNVIPVRAYAPYLADDFQNKGRYYRSAAGGGTYTPQPGDIIFMYDTYNSPRHVGIVSAVYSGVVYYIDGNADYTINGVTTDRVSYRSSSLTSTNIVAYANPAYSADTHTITHWETDSLGHWAECEACNLLISEEHFLVMTNEGYLVCDVCGYC